jgi:SAM-dependent methyltransferase
MDIDDYTKRYVAQYEGDEWFERVLVDARRSQVLESLARHPHQNVLEVGCGMEPFFANVAAFDAWTIVEPSHAFVEHAREAAAPREGVRAIEGFLEDVAPTLASERFDFIVVSSLLHEVPDPARLLASLRSLSTERTVLHLNVPNVRSMHRLLALEMGLIADLFEKSEMEKKFQRTSRYDQATLRAACEAAGFEVVREATYYVKPFTHRQMEKIIDTQIVDRKLLDALGRMTKYVPDLGAEMYVELRRR